MMLIKYVEIILCFFHFPYMLFTYSSVLVFYPLEGARASMGLCVDVSSGVLI